MGRGEKGREEFNLTNDKRGEKREKRVCSQSASQPPVAVKRMVRGRRRRRTRVETGAFGSRRGGGGR